jgi:hypothetical protein
MNINKRLRLWSGLLLGLSVAGSYAPVTLAQQAAMPAALNSGGP